MTEPGGEGRKSEARGACPKGPVSCGEPVCLAVCGNKRLLKRACEMRNQYDEN